MNADTRRRKIILQFWAGDRDAALRLARFIAEVEPEFNPHVDFVFCSRYDAEPPDKATVDAVARRFNVQTVRASRLATGHPFGCWVLWFSAIEWMLTQSPMKWAMTIESDCVPLTRDWLDQLDAEWDRQPVEFRLLGCNAEGGVSHINGNMLISGEHDFLKWVVTEVGLGGCPRQEGWDTWLFPRFLKWGCRTTPLMQTNWQTRTVPAGFYESIRRSGRVFHHGVKDVSLLKMVKAAVLGR